MQNTKTPFERAMTLAALSGLKIALGPAFLATSKGRPNRGAWVAAAVGEMVLDKVGIFPARYRPVLLIPHTIAGAWVARESMREDGGDENQAAMMGAVVAAGVACIAPMIRIAASRMLGIPDLLLGAGEDYLALKYGTQAMDMQMDHLPNIVKEAVEEVGDRLKPALHSVGVGA